MRYDDEYRGGESDTATKLTYLLIGGGIGAILALLFAPKSGEELRGDLADATRKGIDRSRETAGQISERAGEYYGTARERAGEYYEATRERAGELYDSARNTANEAYSTAADAALTAKETALDAAGNVKEVARDTVARKGNQLSAALDAGRKAYVEEKRRTESSSLLQGGPAYPEDDLGKQ